jgi:hypothetical protein
MAKLENEDGNSPVPAESKPKRGVPKLVGKLRAHWGKNDGRRNQATSSSISVSGQSSHYNPSASTSQASIDPGTGVATQATGQTSEDSNNLALTPKAGQASLGSQAALATRVIGQDSQDIGNQDLTSKLNVEQSQQVTPLPGPSRDLRTILNQQTLGQEYQGIESTQISSYTPISELWNEAYEDLRTKEKILVVQYEETLSGRLKTIQAGSLIGGLTALVPVTVLSSSKIKRKDQMQTILEAMMEEANQKTWKLRFGSEYEISARDVMQPLVGAINGANDYITGVLSPNPYASLAWAGVSLLLPVCTELFYDVQLSSTCDGQTTLFDCPRSPKPLLVYR